MGILSRTSLYRTVDVDGNQEPDYLDTSIGDLSLTTIDSMVINMAFEGRPDLISYNYYGNYNLGWLIAYHNDMLDPQREMVAGVRINIPSLDEYYRFVNRNRKNKQ